MKILNIPNYNFELEGIRLKRETEIGTLRFFTLIGVKKYKKKTI